MPTDLSRDDQIKYGSAAVAVILIGFFGLSYWMAAPQIGTDEEVYKTVDALFTAVTSKDRTRLDDCEKRIRTYRDEKKLPPAASTRLEKILKQAQSGQWDTSAQTLYQFMLAQRR